MWAGELFGCLGACGAEGTVECEAEPGECGLGGLWRRSWALRWGPWGRRKVWGLQQGLEGVRTFTQLTQLLLPGSARHGRAQAPSWLQILSHFPSLADPVL